MGKYASTYVDLLQDWVGKNEADGSHMDIINIYNNHRPLARNYKVKSTDSWCATTISAAAIKLGYTDIMPIECSCGRLIERCKKKGTWIENENRTPKPGEWIFYDWDDDGKGDNTGWPEHVGCVEAVAGGKITVIEGNYKNKVERRVINVNAKNIRGYNAPKYDPEPTKKPTTTSPTSKKKSIIEIAKEVIAGKWGSGSTRKNKLEAKGYDYDSVQDKVNELTKTTGDKKPEKKIYSGAFPTLPKSGYLGLGDGYQTNKTYKPQIKRLQNFLNWCIGTELKADGFYGENTRDAVVKFQKKHGLVPDGKFGQKSLAKAKTIKK